MAPIDYGKLARQLDGGSAAPDDWEPAPSRGSAPSSSRGVWAAPGAGTSVRDSHGGIVDTLTGGAAAFASGVISDPFVGAALSMLSEVYPEVDPDTLQRSLASMRGQPADRWFEIAGSILPMFATGLPAMAVGRAAGAGIARMASPVVAKYAARGAGDAFMMAPAALRAGQIGGMAAGAGIEGTARGLAGGEELPEALKHGAIAAGLVGGTELGLIGAHRLLRPGRPTPLAELMAEPNPGYSSTHTALRDRLATVNSELAVLHQSPTRWTHDQAMQVAELRQQQAALKVQLTNIPTTAVGASQARMEEASKAFAARADKLNETYDALVAHGGADPDELRHIAMESKQARTAGRAATAVAGYLADPERSHTAAAFYYGLPQASVKAVKLFPGVTIPARTVEWLGSIKRKLLESPETTARRLGVTVTRAVDQVSYVSRDARALSIMWGLEVDDSLRKIAGAITGPGRRTVHNTAKWLTPLRDMWETPGQGLAAIESAYGTQAAQEWNQLMLKASQFHEMVVSMGVEPKLLRETLATLGVENHFPQMIHFTAEQINDQAIQRVIDYQLRKHGTRLTWEEGRAKLQELAEQMSQGLKRAGSLDFQRTMPGTTAEKAQLLGMETDPRKALLGYGNGIAHRYAWGKVFGPNMELKPVLLEAAMREGANPAAAREVLDNLLGVQYYNQAMYDTAKFLTQTQILTKLGLAWIPNATQSANNFVMFGLRDGYRGMVERFRGVDRGNIDEAIGAYQGMADSIQDVILGQDRGGVMDHVIRNFLWGTGFSPLEEFNRVGSAFTGQYVIRDTVGKLATGRLRGARYAEAERMFDKLGMSLNGIARTLKSSGQWGKALTNQEIDLAIGRGPLLFGISNAAKVLQFVPDVTRLPEWWVHPVGRIVFQFKSFAYNQAKFIRDSVVAEAAEGNMRPLLGLLTTYQPTGEAVNALQSWFTGRPRESSGIQRMAENVAAMGAFGLALSGAASLTYGDGAAWLLGPAFSDAIHFAEAGFADEPMSAVWREIERKPTYLLGRSLGRVGVGAVDVATELYDVVSPTSGPRSNVPAITSHEQLQELLRRK